MIFGPDGKPLCEPLGSGDEGILKADVNLRDIDYPKAFIDVVGHCKKKKPETENIPLQAYPSWIGERRIQRSSGTLLTLCVADARPDLLSLLVNPTKDTHVTKMAK